MPLSLLDSTTPGVELYTHSLASAAAEGCDVCAFCVDYVQRNAPNITFDDKEEWTFRLQYEDAGHSPKQMIFQTDLEEITFEFFSPISRGKYLFSWH